MVSFASMAWTTTVTAQPMVMTLIAVALMYVSQVSSKAVQRVVLVCVRQVFEAVVATVSMAHARASTTA